MSLQGNQDLLFYHLTLDGTQEGDQLGNVDGSITPKILYAQPSAGERWEIFRMMVQIRDDAPFSAVKYGGLVELTNGLNVGIFRASDDVEILDLTPERVKNNSDWARACFDFEVFTLGGGDTFAAARWEFTRDTGGRGILLDEETYLGILIEDDLTGLVDHRFLIRGVKF